MRSAMVVAGLAAAVAADTYTVTHTEDVTVTSCGPTVANCPYASSTAYEWGVWSSTTTSSKKADPTTSEYWGEWSSSTTSSKKADPTSSTAVWSEWVGSSTTSKKADPTSSSAWGEWVGSSSSTTSKKADPTSSTGAWSEWVSTTTPVVATSTGSAACPSYTATGVPEWFSLLPSEVLSSVAAKWTGAPPADWCYYTYSTASMKTSSTPVAPTSSPWYPASKPASATGTGVWSSWSASSTVTAPVAKWTGAANTNAGSIALAGLAAAAAMVMA